MEVSAGHASRSSSLIRVKESLARVSQSDLKLAETRQWVVHVAPSRGLRQRQVKDGRINAMGCVGSCYPSFTVFNVLDHRNIVVI
jgi:hypothetical protein